MDLSRRDFLKLAGTTAALFHLPIESCSEAAKTLVVGETTVIWLELAACTGCSVSLLNGSDPDIASLITQRVALRFHEALQVQSGSRAMQVLDEAMAGEHGAYLLVVEGAIPAGESPDYTMIGTRGDQELTALEAARELADAAAGVVAVGACATFGGVPAARGADTGSLSVRAALERDDILAVPGCPPHPAWIASTLVAVEAGATIDTDDHGRPRAIFGQTVHDLCPRRDWYERSDFAETPGDPVRCFYDIGCKGPWTFANCPEIRWHDGRMFCIDANHPCVGCAAEGFIDRPADTGVMSMSPFYDVLAGGIGWRER